MHRRLASMLRCGSLVLSIALPTTTILLLGTFPTIYVDAYSVGDVDPRALRGVWRLTSLDEGGLPFERTKQQHSGRGFFPDRSSSDPKTIWKLSGFLPMKEFTTYPKKKMSDVMSNDDDDDVDDDDDATANSVVPKKQTEIFIKLKDDHTFQQCSDLYDEETSSSLEDQLEMELSKREKESFAWKGTWDFIDGKLILAADRPEKKPFSVYDDDYDGAGKDGKEGDDGTNGGFAESSDTILVGKVAVQSGDSLTDNPALLERRRRKKSEDRDDGTPETKKGSSSSGLIEMSDEADVVASNPALSSSSSSSQPKKGTSIDVHLSVPKGKIKTGKFMYPKTHPSFFEQPIYRPESKGRFELRQILGDHNAKNEDDDDENDLAERFRKKDLVGKRFYLSTFPLPKRRKKFERWDVAENRYVQDEYAPTAKEKKEEDLEPGNNMQVMAVELFANNTFSTLAGLGSSTVLRGRWSIIGDKRDQLWMMVSRFGFGRSVSGSTFSEGTSLTQNDEKSYWGLIEEVAISGGAEGNIAEDETDAQNKKIQIEGAVMLGWGLEPCSIGRYKMIEMEDDMLEEEEDEEEEDDEYEEMSADDVIESANSLDSILGTEEEDVDGGSDPFDSPGAFE